MGIDEKLLSAPCHLLFGLTTYLHHLHVPTSRRMRVVSSRRKREKKRFYVLLVYRQNNNPIRILARYSLHYINSSMAFQRMYPLGRAVVSCLAICRIQPQHIHVYTCNDASYGDALLCLFNPSMFTIACTVLSPV